MENIRVVILNFNQSQLTLNLVSNLKSQRYCRLEIIVVDNASIDREVQLLKQNLSEDVILILLSNNFGYAKGNNIGMKYKTDFTPEYYFILNNDIVIEDELLVYKLVDSLKLNQKIVAVSPLVNTISINKSIADQIQVRRVLPKFKQYIVCLSILKPFTKKLFNYYIYKESMPFVNKLTICDSINGAAFLVRTEFMRMNNFLDEGTFLFFEEIIFGRQIKDAGCMCLLNGNVSVKHLQGTSTKSNRKSLNVNMEKEKYKSEIYYFRKYCDLNIVLLKLYLILKEIEIIIKKVFYKLGYGNN